MLRGRCCERGKVQAAGEAAGDTVPSREPSVRPGPSTQGPSARATLLSRAAEGAHGVPKETGSETLSLLEQRDIRLPE